MINPPPAIDTDLYNMENDFQTIIQSDLNFNNLGYSYFQEKLEINTYLKNQKALISPQNKSLKNTLSSRYGLESFPFHTDKCADSNPPHFVVIKFLGPSSCKVDFNLVDMKPAIADINIKYLNSKAVFKLNTGVETKFIQLIDYKNECTIIRFNPAIIEPVNTYSLDLLIAINRYIQDQNQIKLSTSENSTIIFDNYRYLHSRGKVNIEDLNLRKVERTWIFN